jgi:hypothetical protein
MSDSGEGAPVGGDPTAPVPTNPTAEVPTASPPADAGAPHGEIAPGRPAQSDTPPPPYGSPPWSAGAAPGPWPGAATPPPGAPPGGWYGPWGPWGGWGGWGPPGPWSPTAPPRPPRPRRPARPWLILGAALATLLLVGAGIGIGFGVWGTGQTAASARVPTRVVPTRVVPTRVLPTRVLPGVGGTSARRAFLGVEVGQRPSTSGPASTTGAYVLGVVSGSPAAKAGITAGDTITRFGTQTVDGAATLAFDVRGDAPGQHVKVSWTTPAGKHVTTTVTLTTRRSATG